MKTLKYAGGLFASALASVLLMGAATPKNSDIDLKQVQQQAEDAYIFGYPLVLMDITRDVGINTIKPEGTRAPINQLLHLRAFPDVNMHDVIRPNVDTLYTISHMDLSKEPLILTLPYFGDRYYLMPLLDHWTNVFADPGTRTTGNRAGHFAIVGPSWSGTLPQGIPELRSSTNDVWLIGRIQTNGPDDFAAVNALQDQIKLVPLSAFGADYIAPDGVVNPDVDVKTPPPVQVNNMTTEQFFSQMNKSMVLNPPVAADADIMARIEKLGVAPGRDFSVEKMDKAVVAAIDAGIASAKAKMSAAQSSAPVDPAMNGWVSWQGTGSYGTRYFFRAVVARYGLGANLSADAIYMGVYNSTDGKALDGSNNYVIHYSKEQLPQVSGFWSITLYDADGYFVANPLNRYAIGDRNNLKYNEDGSLDLYVQNQSPGADKESNWLPAPAGNFNLLLRLYWPSEDTVKGIWKPVGVEKVN